MSAQRAATGASGVMHVAGSIKTKPAVWSDMFIPALKTRQDS